MVKSKDSTTKARKLKDTKEEGFSRPLALAARGSFESQSKKRKAVNDFACKFAFEMHYCTRKSRQSLAHFPFTGTGETSFFNRMEPHWHH